MKNTKDFSEYIKILKEDVNGMHTQMSKTDMYALYYQKTLEDLAKFEQSSLNVDSFYKNFKLYLSEAIEKEMSIGNPDYSVEAGLESALDLLEWYYLKCQNSDVPFEYTSKIYRNTMQLKTILDNFVESCSDTDLHKEISSGVKARIEIVIKILDGLITDLLNPTEDVSDCYDRFDDDSDCNITYPNIDDPDDLEDLNPAEIFSVEEGTRKEDSGESESSEDSESSDDALTDESSESVEDTESTESTENADITTEESE